MPCRSCTDEYSGGSRVEYRDRDNPKLVKRLDDVTAILCDTMNELRERDRKLYLILLKRSRNLSKWWKEHQEQDIKRTGKRFSRVKL